MPNVQNRVPTNNHSVKPDLPRDNLRGDVAGHQNQGPAHTEHDDAHSRQLKSRSTSENKFKTPVR